jgi:hypothetical protein
LIVCTATAESVEDPVIRAKLADVLGAMDALVVARFERARVEGKLAPGIDPVRRAPLVAATIHSLAVRARAGMGRALLEAMADEAAAVLAR